MNVLCQKCLTDEHRPLIVDAVTYMDGTAFCATHAAESAHPQNANAQLAVMRALKVAAPIGDTDAHRAIHKQTENSTYG